VVIDKWLFGEVLFDLFESALFALVLSAILYADSLFLGYIEFHPGHLVVKNSRILN